MKFNIGTGIFIFLILFVGAGIYFVIFAFNQNVNLVDKAYYEHGANYSQEMEIRKRSLVFQQNVRVSNQDQQVVVQLLEPLNKGIDSLNLHFYRPSDSRLDLKLKAAVINDRVMLPKQQLSKGRYELFVSWTLGQKFKIKKEFIVQ